MAQTNGRITPEARIGAPPSISAYDWQSRKEPAQANYAVSSSRVPSSKKGNIEIWQEHAKQYTPSPIPLRSLSAPHPSQTFSSKRKYFILYSPRHSHPPASLRNFQRSEGLAQVAMKCRYLLREALSAPSELCRHLFTVVLPAFELPLKFFFIKS